MVLYHFITDSPWYRPSEPEIKPRYRIDGGAQLYHRPGRPYPYRLTHRQQVSRGIENYRAQNLPQRPDSTNGTFLVKGKRAVPFVKEFVSPFQAMVIGNRKYNILDLPANASEHIARDEAITEINLKGF